MNGFFFQIVVRCIIASYGMYFVLAYFFDWKMYTGGAVLESGKRRPARIFFLLYGVCIVIAASYSLWAALTK